MRGDLCFEAIQLYTAISNEQGVWTFTVNLLLSACDHDVELFVVGQCLVRTSRPERSHTWGIER